MTSRQNKKVLKAKQFLDGLTRQVEKKVKNERISELLRGKGFLERLELLIK